MKSIIAYITLSLTIMLVSVGVYAQVDMEQGAALLKPILEMLMGYLPENIVAIMALIGGFRTVLKPLMMFLGSLAEASGKESLQLKYAEIEGGNTYKTIVFLFDYLFSIKLPVNKKY